MENQRISYNICLWPGIGESGIGFTGRGTIGVGKEYVTLTGAWSDRRWNQPVMVYLFIAALAALGLLITWMKPLQMLLSPSGFWILFGVIGILLILPPIIAWPKNRSITIPHQHISLLEQAGAHLLFHLSPAPDNDRQVLLSTAREESAAALYNAIQTRQPGDFQVQYGYGIAQNDFSIADDGRLIIYSDTITIQGRKRLGWFVVIIPIILFQMLSEVIHYFASLLPGFTYTMEIMHTSFYLLVILYVIVIRTLRNRWFCKSLSLPQSAICRASTIWRQVTFTVRATNYPLTDIQFLAVNEADAKAIISQLRVSS